MGGHRNSRASASTGCESIPGLLSKAWAELRVSCRAPERRRPWDAIVLTAASPSQAALYTRYPNSRAVPSHFFLVSLFLQVMRDHRRTTAQKVQAKDMMRRSPGRCMGAKRGDNTEGVLGRGLEPIIKERQRVEAAHTQSKMDTVSFLISPPSDILSCCAMSLFLHPQWLVAFRRPSLLFPSASWKLQSSTSTSQSRP